MEKDVPDINVGKWISVNDRLPSREGLEDDESLYVLVAEYFNITDNYCVSICAYGKDGWDEVDNFGHVAARRITHWQLLPEPPKGE